MLGIVACISPVAKLPTQSRDWTWVLTALQTLKNWSRRYRKEFGRCMTVREAFLCILVWAVACATGSCWQVWKCRLTLNIRSISNFFGESRRHIRPEYCRNDNSFTFRERVQAIGGTECLQTCWENLLGAARRYDKHPIAPSHSINVYKLSFPQYSGWIRRPAPALKHELVFDFPCLQSL